VSVEQRPHALRELRLCLFDILPRRHTLMIAPVTRQHGLGFGRPYSSGRGSVRNFTDRG
jgi:hypothetical protein